MDYFVVKLSQVSAQAEDWLSQRAFAHGALGVSEALSFRQPEGEEDVFIASPAARNLDVYFQQAPPRSFLEGIHGAFPEVRAQVSREQEKDWLEEWKKGFEPFALTQDHWVVPSWRTPPAQAKFAIRIDPGMAFGTGTHETTQLAARELEQIPARGSLLDVGCGTGILAILGAQLGYQRVAATEIEAEARRVARENFARNGVAVEMDQRQVEELEQTFDVVVANIIDGVLVRIQDALKPRVRAGGWLVVSGIIKEREGDFLSGFHLPQGRTWRRREQGDWLLFVAQL